MQIPVPSTITCPRCQTRGRFQVAHGDGFEVVWRRDGLIWRDLLGDEGEVLEEGFGCGYCGVSRDEMLREGSADVEA